VIIGSVVIPVLNEGSNIERVLGQLQPMRRRGWKLIVVDGGSEDDTIKKAEPLASLVLSSRVGRAIQMNTGARQAEGEVIVFLHADTVLPLGAESVFSDFVQQGSQWGRFDVQLSGTKLMFLVIAWFINWRSRITGIATGDQALFFRRHFFDSLQGYADIPLMEDVEICKRCKSLLDKPYCSELRVKTSSRKWEREGTWKTIWLMWCLRYAYYRGADPIDLYRKYYSC